MMTFGRRSTGGAIKINPVTAGRTQLTARPAHVGSLVGSGDADGPVSGF